MQPQFAPSLSNRRLSDLPLLDEKERARLAQARNTVCPDNAFEPFVREDIEQSLVDRFEQQCSEP
jgi:hypothetical protein